MFYVVGIWYIMWDNIGKVKENRNDMDLLPSHRQPQDARLSDLKEPLLVNADCRSSTKGLFAGNINHTILISCDEKMR